MIEDNEIINIFSNKYLEWKEKHNCNYYLHNFKLNELNIDLRIAEHDTDKFVIIIYVDTFEGESILLDVIDDKSFKQIQDVFKFLLFDFRNNYIYSKILDKIVKVTEQINLEKYYIASQKLLRQKVFDTCCVCFEYNTVITSCNHNLCRACYAQIKYENTNDDDDDDDDDEQYLKKCPLCRNRI
jgi:hypothetical protein